MTSSEWLHFLDPEPPQLPRCGGKAWGHAPFQALMTPAQGAVVSTECLSARQTGTEPGKMEDLVKIRQAKLKKSVARGQINQYNPSFSGHSSHYS